MEPFRVLVDVSECDVAGVSGVWVLIDGRGAKEGVSWVSSRVVSALCTGLRLGPDAVDLCLDGALLPPDEPLHILQPGDKLTAIPAKRCVTTTVCPEPELEAHKRRALQMLEKMTESEPEQTGQATTPCDSANTSVELPAAKAKRRRVRRRRPPGAPPPLTGSSEGAIDETSPVDPAQAGGDARPSCDDVIVHNPAPLSRMARCIRSLPCA